MTLNFRLPVPPSKNTIPAGWTGIKIRRAAMLDIWASACNQHQATTSPPDYVTAVAHFVVGSPWDRGNLWTALYSIVFDALQLPVGGDPSWRLGLAERKGFIVDDSESHLQLLSVTQTVEPNRKRRFLYLTIEPAARP